jgi:hypothetical protein
MMRTYFKKTSLVVEHLPSMHKALVLIPSPAKKKRKEKKK